MKDLVIAGKKFNSRFFLGTGKFASKQQLAAALAGDQEALLLASGNIGSFLRKHVRV